MKKIYLTREGYEKLVRELEELKKKFMYEISERIKEARELGDLSENSEYEAAKNEQGRVGSRIMEIEQILNNAEIIDEMGEGNEVSLGKWVVIKDLDTEEEYRFRIVTPQEADFFSGKLSADSPLGKNLLGRKVGEIVKVKAPGGIRRYQVLAIMNG